MSSAIAKSTTTFRRRKPRQRSSSASSSSVSDYEQDDWNTHKQHLASEPEPASHEASPTILDKEDGPTLLTLPMEIIVHHLLPQLNYPSLLALRLSHPRFYHSPLLYPSRAAAIRLRVAWLLELGSRGLRRVAPRLSGSVDIATDRTFLANRHVQEMLREERSNHVGSWLPHGLGMTWDRSARPSFRSRVRSTLLSIGVMAILLSIAIAVVAVTTEVLRSSLRGIRNMLLFDGT